MTAGVLKRLERTEALTRALFDPPAVPDPVELFRAAHGEPDDWQVRALRSEAPRLAMNVHRQGGKTGVAATLACWTALAEAGALVLVVSPSLRQSQEAFRRVLEVYRASGRLVPSEAETKLTLELTNASRIVALPGTERTVRGFAGVRLLVVDEAARVPDDLIAAVRPMLAVSHGRLVTLSTPWGRRGWWFTSWTEGGPGWARFEVPATHCPRISAEALEEERLSLGPLFFESEYLCRFVDNELSVFDSELVEAAIDPSVAPLWEDIA